MGLSNAEVVRLRAELGYNAVQVANPYLTSYALFETIIKTYVEDGGDTTSSTPVTAAAGGIPAVVTLTLVDSTIANVGDRVIVDVDSLEERSTIRNKSGSTIDVLLALAHSGTYRVAVDGGVAMVREKLKYIRDLSDQIQSAAKTAGLKRVDEIEFFAPEQMVKVLGPAGALWEQREWERKELANFLGVMYLREVRQTGQSQSLVPC